MSRILELAFDEVKNTKCSFRDDGRTLVINDAFIFWSNFEGKENKWKNSARTFNVAIDEDTAAYLQENGWKVRMEILDELVSTIAAPREELSPYAPKIEMIKIDPAKIKDVIGKGGVTIRGITEETGAVIEIEDDGTIKIAASNADQAAEAKKRIEEITADIEVGRIYESAVVRIMDFGAFVNLMPGRDGMVHVSELRWNRIKTPADVVKVGDEIDVYVISFDAEKHKISLGYKTAEMNPWNQFMTNYAVGDVVDAKIVKLMTFGAFAEILPGVDGLIHISQIADRRIGKPEDVLSEGQDVKVKITDVDAENKRISLSIRALLEQPAEEEA